MRISLTKIFKPLKIAIYLLLLIIFLVKPASCQNEKTKLQQNKKKIENEIKYTNKLLTETKKNKRVTINKLIILKNQISKREELIKTINAEIYYLNFQITYNKKTIKKLTNELNDLKKEYAKMIYSAYKNKNSENYLMFIFSSEDFNQAYQRIRYFHEYSEYRKKQVENIKRTQEEIDNKNKLLKKQKNKKLSLLQIKEKEKRQLTKEKQAKNNTIRKLSQKEKKLLKTLKQKERKARKLQKEIEKIIAEEIRKSNIASKKPSSKNFALTPEEAVLSKSFFSNKGKLPWPTERGIVSNTFGEHKHPVLKYVKIKNNGIDIITNKGAYARVIFNGTVSRVISIPNYNKVVIIRHGGYLTVYSNLYKVFVKRGDKVNTKQKIGIIYTNTEESKTELHFEIWKGKKLLNPSYWLIKK